MSRYRYRILPHYDCFIVQRKRWLSFSKWEIVATLGPDTTSGWSASEARKAAKKAVERLKDTKELDALVLEAK